MDDKSKIHELTKHIRALELEIDRLRHTDQPCSDRPLGEGQDLCRDMIESQRELICRFLTDGTLTFVNNAYCQYFARTKEELIGTNFFDLIPLDAHKQAKAHLKSITLDNPVKSFAHPVITPDGRKGWQQWSDCGLFSKNGDLTGYQSVGRDITELKEAEALLMRREAKLKALVQDVLNDTDVGLCILDGNLQSVWINKSLERFFGCKWNDIVGKDKKTIIKQKFAPLLEDPNTFEQKLMDTYSKDALLHGFQCRILESDSVSERWLDIRSKPVKSGYYAGGRIEQYTDITQLKRSEIALRESEQRFKDLANLLPEAVYEADITGTITYANKVAFEYFGYTPADLEKGYNVLDMIHPDERQRLKSNIDQILQGNESGLNEYLAVRKDGSTFPIWSGSALIKQNGEATGFRGFLLDISEHKQNIAELELLRTAIEQVSDAIEITDDDGNMQYVNPAMEKITGYTRDELIGKNPKMFKSDKQAPGTYENLWQTIASGKKWRGQLINRKKDGNLYSADISITPVRNSKNEIVKYVAVKRDVTEETKKEEQMRHLQKMEALATLAGGIAHDFNNILAGVLGFSELSLEDVPAGSEVHQNLTETIKGCIRAKKLIEQILRFTKIDEADSKPHKVQNIIEDVLSLLRSTLPTTIEIKKRIASTGLVSIGPTHMHQVVMNLCTNAFHAMEETGGRLGVSLTSVELTLDDVIDLQRLNPGSYAKLSISDTGHGMDSETAKKIFDPYFTTKEKDRGTGLGLSMVHGIVTRCGGAIEVYSEVGVGTTFDIYLPVVGQKEGSDTDPSLDAVQPTGAGERILFVDDEQVIVKIGTQMLNRLGYQVAARTSSTEALEAFRANPYNFDLVITDMTMPNMTGDRLAQELKAIRPDIPIIVCTGFTTRINETKATALGISTILTKPVAKSDFAQAVRDVLKKR